MKISVGLVSSPEISPAIGSKRLRLGRNQTISTALSQNNCEFFPSNPNENHKEEPMFWKIVYRVHPENPKYQQEEAPSQDRILPPLKKQIPPHPSNPLFLPDFPEPPIAQRQPPEQSSMTILFEFAVFSCLES